jgi:hypothetical protein
MNDSEFNQVLKSARVPEPSPEYWRGFPKTVLRRLRQEGDRGGGTEPRRRPALPLWGLGLATTCLVLGFALGLWRRRPPLPGNVMTAQNLTLLREVTALFPNSVRAIVADEAGVRLVLSDRPDVPVSNPLLIRVCRGDKCQSVITFSGQTVELAGVPLEVLADAQGHVLLVGERQVWSSAKPGRLFTDGKVEARVLQTVL